MIRASLFRIAGLALALLPLSACGFTPVYGSSAELKDAGPISIPEIRGRTGHFLRQELIRTVGQGLPGVKGEAELEIRLAESIERLAFAADQAASRSDYVGSATWVLRAPTGLPIASGGVVERASFNFADAAYADLAAQTAAQERLATLLARSIREQMTIEVRNPRTTPTATPVAPPAAPAVPGARTTTPDPLLPPPPRSQ
jgi:LPS-assembly lipoprotein